MTDRTKATLSPEQSLPICRARPKSLGRATFPHGSVRGGFLARLARALRALDNHWLGDLLGVISLFGMLYLLLFIGWAVSS